MQAIIPARAVGRATVTAPVQRATPKPQPTPTPDQFREYMLQLMAENGFETVVDLARAAGIDPSNLSRWFSGKTGPALGVLMRLEQPLGVRLGELMVMAGMATPEQLGMGSPPPPADVREILDELDGMPESERKATVVMMRGLLGYRRNVQSSKRKASRGQR